MNMTNSKWLPPQQEGFGPWIEWAGLSKLPIEKRCVFHARTRDGSTITSSRPEDYRWSHWGGPCDIVAYCVKLEEQSAEPQQPAASGLTRLVPLREKALHTLEETATSDPQVTCWGVSLDGVPMVRLDTLAGAQQVQRLADAAFQAGRQKAFSDLLDFVEGQR